MKWDDPTLAIKWPINPSVISEKDTNAKSFQSFLEDFGSIKV
jgi:dTDP-4-dehydrorhamnose 3,5-epimerase-like enzyme